MELLIVGLDGLSWNILDRFDYRPPFLSSVASDGISGDLFSVDTPTTIPAWTSFATGKDPGTHGVTNMVTQTSKYEVSAPETNTEDAAAYDLLDDAFFVNLPATADRIPASETSYLVSSFGAEGPEDAIPEPLHHLPAFEDYRTMQRDELKATPDRFIDDLVDIADSRVAFTEQAIDELDPSVCFVLFSVTDWLGHVLGNADDDATRADWVERVVGTVDSHARELAADAENVLLMSDHGFEHKHANLHLNEYLADRGYLTQSASESSRRANLIVSVARSFARRSDKLYELMRGVYNRIIAYDVASGIRDAASFEIDYAQSDAWELRFGSIHVNDDVFDSPTVDDVESVRSELIEELSSLTYEGQPVFREVLRSEDAYADPGQNVPSIIARPSEGIYPLMFQSPTGDILSPTDAFEHRYRGLVSATGPLFDTSSDVEGMGIEDILPTVLHALDEPVPRDMTGSVRSSLLETNRPVDYVDPQIVPAPRTNTDSIERNKEERLESLGYI